MARNFLGTKVSVLSLDTLGSTQKLVSMVSLRPSVQVTINLQTGLAASRRRKHTQFCSKPSETVQSLTLATRKNEPMLLGQISDITEFVPRRFQESGGIFQIPRKGASRQVPLRSSEQAPVWTPSSESALVPTGPRLVCIRGVGKGHGFAGVVSRYGFSRGPMTRGSKHHRAPGSAGAGTFPSRVYPRKKMPGRWKTSRRKYNRVRPLKLDVRHSLLWLQGSVPGKTGNIIQLSPV